MFALEQILISANEPLPIDESIINKARNDLIFEAQAPTIFTIVAVILVFTYFLSKHVPTTALVVWSSVCIASYVLRYFLCMLYLRSDEVKQSQTYWENFFTVCSVISGLVWGGAILVIYPEDSTPHQLLMILLLVILSAATTVTHSAFRWAGFGYSVCALLPTLFVLFLGDREGYPELGAFIVFFLFIMLFSSTFIHKISNRIFSLSYENNKLINDLKKTNASIIKKNELLEEAKRELSAANENLQMLATTDALTSLTNRRKFEAYAKVKWQRSSELEQSISLLLINVDMFKQYNDFYGQRKGDSCLLQIADYLRTFVEINRTGDCISRYSGDEFAILLIDSDKTYAKQVAEKIRKDIELLRISRAEMPHELSPWISVSIGISTEESFITCTYEDLLEHADKSLYLAKRNGRNMVCHYLDTINLPS